MGAEQLGPVDGQRGHRDRPDHTAGQGQQPEGGAVGEEGPCDERRSQRQPGRAGGSAAPAVGQVPAHEDPDADRGVGEIGEQRYGRRRELALVLQEVVAQPGGRRREHRYQECGGSQQHQSPAPAGCHFRVGLAVDHATVVRSPSGCRGLEAPALGQSTAHPDDDRHGGQRHYVHQPPGRDVQIGQRQHRKGHARAQRRAEHQHRYGPGAGPGRHLLGGQDHDQDAEGR